MEEWLLPVVAPVISGLGVACFRVSLQVISGLGAELFRVSIELVDTEPAETEIPRATRGRLPPEACTARLHYQNHPRPWGKTGQWRAAFRETMSADEAKVLLGDQSPLNALGLTPGASRAEIKRAWHEMAMKWHPDHNRGNEKEATEQFKRCKAAYLTLTGRA